MEQIKIIREMSKESLSNQTNAFLATLEEGALKDIIPQGNDSIIILYEVIEQWRKRMCAECKYWDDGGHTDSVSGICHECGQRRRFNCRACKSYKDVRD